MFNLSKWGGFVSFLLIVPLVLAACGGDDDDDGDDENVSGVDRVVRFINAVEDNDIDAAKENVCRDLFDEVDTAFELVAEQDTSLEYTNIECTQDGNTVECTFDVNGDANEDSFIIEDGKICGGPTFDAIRALDDVSAEESSEDLLPTSATSSN